MAKNTKKETADSTDRQDLSMLKSNGPIWSKSKCSKSGFRQKSRKFQKQHEPLSFPGCLLGCALLPFILVFLILSNLLKKE